MMPTLTFAKHATIMLTGGDEYGLAHVDGSSDDEMFIADLISGKGVTSDEDMLVADQGSGHSSRSHANCSGRERGGKR